jgi:hypothetical protein
VGTLEKKGMVNSKVQFGNFVKNPVEEKKVEEKQRYDPVELRKQLTQNTYMLRKMKQQGDYHAAGAVLAQYSIAEIQKNDPKPLDEKAKEEELPAA